MLEKKTQLFLPNEFEIRQTVGYEIGDKEVILGRLESFYFLALKGVEKITTARKHLPVKRMLKRFRSFTRNGKRVSCLWLNEVELVR